MNFFFTITNKELNCDLTVPRFRNNSLTKKNYQLYSAIIIENKWLIEKTECEKNENFYFLNSNQLNNEKIFFLATNEEVNDKINLKNINLVDYNDFTNTLPDFRANLSINLNKGGFSSYQSEYPFSMSLKQGNILSPVSTLLNKDADKNYIFIRNIYHKPIKEKFDVFFIDIINKKIIDKLKIQTNYSNEIKVNNELIKPNIYLYSNGYLGVPIFISINNSHISMEHTHPPHLYIAGNDKFKRISNLKKEIYEIIIKKNSSE